MKRCMGMPASGADSSKRAAEDGWSQIIAAQMVARAGTAHVDRRS